MQILQPFDNIRKYRCSLLNVKHILLELSQIDREVTSFAILG